MSLRALAGLVLLLAGVIGLLVWLGREKPAAETPPEHPPLVAAFEESSVRRLRVACGGRTIALERAGESGWRILEPIRAEADPRRIHEIVVALQEARVGKVVSDGGFDAKAFALDSGCRVEATLMPDGERTIRLGRSSPVGTERYAVGADGRLVLTDGALYGVIDRDPAALVERRLFPFEAEGATRIVVDRPAGRLVLAETGERWRLTEPVADEAATSACTNLARALAALETEAVPDTRPPVASRHDRRLGFEIQTAASTRPLRGFIAAAGIGGKRLAWREDGSLVGLVEESAVRDLDAGPDAYRDKQVAAISPPDIRSVAVTRGAMRLDVERSEDGVAWSGTDSGASFAVDGARVQALVDRLSRLTAEGFVEGAAPSQATGTIEIRGSEGELATLSWGPLAPLSGESGESVWATTTSRPGVLFRVRATALGPVPTKSADWAAAGGS